MQRRVVVLASCLAIVLAGGSALASGLLDLAGRWSVAGKRAAIQAQDPECPGFDYLVVDEAARRACARVKGDRLDIPDWKAFCRASKDGGRLNCSDGKTWTRERKPRPTEDQCARAQQDCMARCIQIHHDDVINRASCWGGCNSGFLDCLNMP